MWKRDCFGVSVYFKGLGKSYLEASGGARSARLSNIEEGFHYVHARVESLALSQLSLIVNEGACAEANLLCALLCKVALANLALAQHAALKRTVLEVV